MVPRKDIAGSWAYFLSLSDIFFYNMNSKTLMSDLVSAVKSLLIELSSATKYEYIIGLNVELAKMAYSVLNIIYAHYWVPATIIIVIYRSWNDSLWGFKVLMLLQIHVQIFEYATHVDEMGDRHLALA